MVVTINNPEDRKPEDSVADEVPNEEAAAAPKQRFAVLKDRFAALLPKKDTLRALQTPGGRRAVIGVLGSYTLLTLGLGYYWSLPPDSFDVVDNRDRYLSSTQPLTGAATTSALLEVTRLLLEKNGGYLSNDITPPGTFMDNMPSWEYGVLIQSRIGPSAARGFAARNHNLKKMWI